MNTASSLHSGVRRAAAAMALIGWLVAGCSSAPPADARLTRVPVIGQTAPVEDKAPVPVLASYMLNFGDELDVRVPDAPQYDQTVKILPDGSINLGLIGTLAAAGRSADSVQTEIRERYQSLAGTDESREYLIHANDELEIKFPYHPTLNELLRVRPDGKIQLQLAGTVVAEGMSPEQLGAELERRYGTVLKSPELAVIVRTATSQNVRTAHGIIRGGLAGLQPDVIVRTFQTPQVFVTGEVQHPGMLAFSPGMSLLQAIAASGGSLPSGDVTKLVVLRRSGQRGAELQQSAELLRPQLSSTYRGAPTKDLLLQPYDVVLLPPTRAQNLADVLDRYVYKIFAPLKNSSFSYVISKNGIIY